MEQGIKECIMMVKSTGEVNCNFQMKVITKENSNLMK